MQYRVSCLYCDPQVPVFKLPSEIDCDLHTIFSCSQGRVDVIGIILAKRCCCRNHRFELAVSRISQCCHRYLVYCGMRTLHDRPSVNGQGRSAIHEVKEPQAEQQEARTCESPNLGDVSRPNSTVGFVPHCYCAGPLNRCCSMSVTEMILCGPRRAFVPK